MATFPNRRSFRRALAQRCHRCHPAQMEGCCPLLSHAVAELSHFALAGRPFALPGPFPSPLDCRRRGFGGSRKDVPVHAGVSNIAPSGLGCSTYGDFCSFWHLLKGQQMHVQEMSNVADWDGDWMHRPRSAMARSIGSRHTHNILIMPTEAGHINSDGSLYRDESVLTCAPANNPASGLPTGLRSSSFLRTTGPCSICRFV